MCQVWRYRAAGLAFLLLALGTAATARSQKPLVVDLPSKFVDFAFNPETGEIAAVDPTASTVHLFRESLVSGKDQAATSPLKVGNLPISICFKRFKSRSVYAIVCLRDAHLYLVDAAEFTMLRKIPLGNSGVSMVASSLNPADPYIYYCYGNGHDCATGRVNLTKLADEGPAFDDSMDMAVTASGRLFYRRGPWSPSGFESLRMIDPPAAGGSPQYVRVFYDHNSTAPYVPDLADTYTAAGTELYTATLNKKVATLDFEALCFFPGRPLILGLKDSDLMAASYNTFHTVGRLSLPWPTREQQQERQEGFSAGGDTYGDFKFNGFKTRMFGDAKRERVILANFDRLVVTPLAALELPDEPLLQVRVELPAAILVGQESRIGLTKADERCQIELVNPPDGAALDNGAIVWRPAGDQVGDHELQLSLKHGDLEVLQAVRCSVARPHVRLPIQANLLAVDAAAARAVCGHIQPGENQLGHEPRTGGQPANTTRLVVVDLATLTVTGETTLPFTAAAIAMDDARIYVAAATSSNMSVITLADLAKPKQIPTDEPIVALQPVAGKHLIATLQSGEINRFTLPELKRSGVVVASKRDTGLERFNDYGGRGATSAIQRVGDGWLLGGLFYDDTLSGVRLLQQPEGILPISDQALGRRTLDRWSRPAADDRSRPWERQEGIPAGIRLGEEAYSPVVLDAVPVKVAASVQRRQEDVATHTWRNVETIRLALYDLFSDTVQEHVVLAQQELAADPQNHHHQWTGGQFPMLQAVGKSIVFAHGDQLFRYDLGDVDPEKFPLPVTIKLDQPTRVIDGAGPTKLKHTIQNATQPLQAALVGSRPEVQIDAATAEVTIDGPALLTALQKLLVGGGQQGGGNLSLMQQFGGAPLSLSSPEWTDYLATAGAKFEKLAGRKPNGIPLAVPIDLRVIDGNNQTAAVSYFVLVDVPTGPIEKALAERAEKAKEAQRVMTERQAAVNRATGNGQIPAGDRVQQLEQRVKALEDKLELLTRLLGQQLGQPPKPTPE